MNDELNNLTPENETSPISDEANLSENDDTDEDANEDTNTGSGETDLNEVDADDAPAFAEVTEAEKKEAEEAIRELQGLLNGPAENLSTMPADKVAYPVGLDPRVVESIDNETKGNNR